MTRSKLINLSIAVGLVTSVVIVSGCTTRAPRDNGENSDNNREQNNEPNSRQGACEGLEASACESTVGCTVDFVSAPCNTPSCPDVETAVCVSDSNICNTDAECREGFECVINASNDICIDCGAPAEPVPIGTCMEVITPIPDGVCYFDQDCEPGQSCQIVNEICFCEPCNDGDVCEPCDCGDAANGGGAPAPEGICVDVVPPAGDCFVDEDCEEGDFCDVSDGGNCECPPCDEEVCEPCGCEAQAGFCTPRDIDPPDRCEGAFLGEDGVCYGPDGDLAPPECCPMPPDPCEGAFLAEDGVCYGSDESVAPAECCPTPVEACDEHLEESTCNTDLGCFWSTCPDDQPECGIDPICTPVVRLSFERAVAQDDCAPNDGAALRIAMLDEPGLQCEQYTDPTFLLEERTDTFVTAYLYGWSADLSGRTVQLNQGELAGAIGLCVDGMCAEIEFALAHFDAFGEAGYAGYLVLIADFLEHPAVVPFEAEFCPTEGGFCG